MTARAAVAPADAARRLHEARLVADLLRVLRRRRTGGYALPDDVLAVMAQLDALEGGGGG